MLVGALDDHSVLCLFLALLDAAFVLVGEFPLQIRQPWPHGNEQGCIQFSGVSRTISDVYACIHPSEP